MTTTMAMPNMERNELMQEPLSEPLNVGLMKRKSSASSTKSNGPSSTAARMLGKPELATRGSSSALKAKSKPRSCMSSGSVNKMNKMKRDVSFSNIEIREYDRAIGDSVTSSGVPISLGWNYSSTGQLDLSSYEELKQPRSQNQLRVPNHERMEMLKQAGYSLHDRMKAVKDTNIERNRRRASAAKTTDIDRAEYMLEKAKRKVRKALKKKKKKKSNTALDKDEIFKWIEYDRQRLDRSSDEGLTSTRSCPVLNELGSSEFSDSESNLNLSIHSVRSEGALEALEF